MENDDTQNPQVPKANMANVPPPAGSDENGNPFWITTDGQRINWQQLQQLLWQQSQSQPGSVQAAQYTGGGVERIPQQVPVQSIEAIPQIPQAPERGPELKPEQNVETQQETASETAQESVQPTPQQAAPVQAQKREPISSSDYFGDSQYLQRTDIDDPNSMAIFSENNKKEPDTSSNKFLSVLFEKLLKILSLGK